MKTAVLDNADSEEPVELPTDAADHELFRRAHVGRTFWCGVWLGGCGGRLTNRLCRNKICHFAHVPNPEASGSPCRRTSSRSSGSGSADHLYVKAALADWMARYGLSLSFSSDLEQCLELSRSPGDSPDAGAAFV
ncbi:hypothetical protein AB0M23_21760 [Streptomyces sp. NPDC052077]|uniref:hypothetical protein n=1 Tax=Streptomyces sp. NPDC052077 TaxID=3154757 RepID=UPI003437CA25